MKHLVLLGPGKAGSTWLYSTLSQSENFCCPQIKETYYFNRNHHRGKAWYMRQFELSQNTHAFGDFSNQNYRYSQTIKNALSDFPDTIFVYLQRDTLDRVMSAYKFEKMNGSTLQPREFFFEWEDIWFSDEKMVAEFKALIPEGQLHIIQFNDIQRNDEVVLLDLSKLLGFKIRSAKNVQKNKSVYPRVAWLAHFGKQISQILRYIGFTKTLQIIKASHLIRKFFYTDREVKLSHNEICQITEIVEERRRSLSSENI